MLELESPTTPTVRAELIRNDAHLSIDQVLLRRSVTIVPKTAATFLDAGWDFLNETANGTDDIWRILEGQDYPRLWWELIAEN